jgi:hypothetical protein
LGFWALVFVCDLVLDAWCLPFGPLTSARPSGTVWP